MTLVALAIRSLALLSGRWLIVDRPTREDHGPRSYAGLDRPNAPSEASSSVGWPPVMVAYFLMVLSAQMLEKYGCLVVGKMERLALKTGLDTWKRM